MEPNPQAQRTDTDRIETIVTALRREFPTLVAFTVTSSDQGSGGYIVTDVTLPDRSTVEVDTVAGLDDELWEDAIWLRWGVFGDRNDESTFDVDVETRKILRPMRYGIVTDYEWNATHKRERLTLWSGAFASQFEGIALALPKGDGYMVTLDYGGKVRVECPTPRNDENYVDIDLAINRALHRHELAKKG